MKHLPGWFVIVGFFVMLWVFFRFAAPVLNDLSLRLTGK